MKNKTKKTFELSFYLYIKVSQHMNVGLLVQMTKKAQSITQICGLAVLAGVTPHWG